VKCLAARYSKGLLPNNCRVWTRLQHQLAQPAVRKGLTTRPLRSAGSNSGARRETNMIYFIIIRLLKVSNTSFITYLTVTLHVL
jgi:hypothetical protein